MQLEKNLMLQVAGEKLNSSKKAPPTFPSARRWQTDCRVAQDDGVRAFECFST
jgi:hypothetical protein